MAIRLANETGEGARHFIVALLTMAGFMVACGALGALCSLIVAKWSDRDIDGMLKRDDAERAAAEIILDEPISPAGAPMLDSSEPLPLSKPAGVSTSVGRGVSIPDDRETLTPR